MVDVFRLSHGLPKAPSPTLSDLHPPFVSRIPQAEYSSPEPDSPDPIPLQTPPAATKGGAHNRSRFPSAFPPSRSREKPTGRNPGDRRGPPFAAGLPSSDRRPRSITYTARRPPSMTQHGHAHPSDSDARGRNGCGEKRKSSWAPAVLLPPHKGRSIMMS